MTFRVLTVGDGDLSFSLALKRAYPQISVTASTLVDSSAELCRTYSTAIESSKEFQDQWNETIIYGVDATKLAEKVIEGDGYDIVLFNHPHLGDATLLESEQRHAERHYALLSHYIFSAKEVLKKDGRIHVCLCGNQPKTWKVMAAAKNSGLECVSQESTACPIDKWLFRGGAGEGDTCTSYKNKYELAEVQTYYPTKRKFRNGSLGSKHFLARYGYRHQRTEGDLFDGSVKHINVEQSINFVFARKDDVVANENNVNVENDSVIVMSEDETNHTCRICKLKFGSGKELSAHLNAPGLPDIVTGACFKKDTVYEKKIPTNQTTELFPPPVNNNVNAKPNERARSTSRSSSFIEPINIQDATILVEATVDSKFGSKRIKWLCRQDGFPLSRFIKSKKQCEDAIKRGRVYVNKEVAFDSGRIVQENDVVSLVEEYHHHHQQSSDNDVHDVHTTTNNNNGVVEEESGFRVVKELLTRRKNEDISIQVVYKPVGIRCVGSFSPNTLEMMTKKHAEQRSCYRKTKSIYCVPISKLDTGCAGLCVLAVSPSSTFSSESSSMHSLLKVEVLYTFTALVHGHPPEEWKRGVYVRVPTEGLRQWKRQKTDDDQQENNNVDAMNGGKPNPIVTSNNALDLNEALFVQFTDSLQMEDDQQSLSTITIQSRFDNGRLANVISFVLRKLGYPVVNDRFGKREYSALPRRMKNIVKQKICIGCYGVDVDYEGVLTKVCIESHKRTQCSFWRETLL